MKIKISKSNNPISSLFAEPMSVVGETEIKKLEIAEELLKMMDQCGISRSDLADRIDVNPSRITSMLSGENNFTVETLVKLGRAMNATWLHRLVPNNSAPVWIEHKNSDLSHKTKVSFTTTHSSRKMDFGYLAQYDVNRHSQRTVLNHLILANDDSSAAA